MDLGYGNGLMIDGELAALYAEIQTGIIQCGLNKCNATAVDYIFQPWGKDDIVEFNLMIPVCLECVDFLGQNDWVLLYCVVCNASQWVYKPIAKLKYGNQNIVWMDTCPKCNNMGL